MVCTLVKLLYATVLIPVLKTTSAALAVKGCTPFRDSATIVSTNSNCFCHVPKEDMHPTDIWSTLQVTISSTGTLKVAYTSDEVNCQNPNNLSVLLKCALQNLWQWGESKERIINLNQYDADACFQVQPTDPSSSYTIHVKTNNFDIRRVLIFCSGLFLFWYASSLSRSAAFYYSAGVSLGMLAMLILLLIILKRFISKLSTFGLLMTAGSAFSIYIISYIKENMNWLWHENKNYVLGYFLVAGLISFAICYKHGPLTNQRSLNLWTWMLEIIGCVLIYFSVAITTIAYLILVVLVPSKGFCYLVRLLCSLGRKIRGFLPFNKPVVRFLTEEEYRDQGETETLKALEELRSFCRSPEFPSWLAMSKIYSPKKFADFVLGSYHVSAEEMRLYDEEYGPGGLFLEGQLFDTRGEPEEGQTVHGGQEEEEVEDNHENHVGNNEEITGYMALI
ncbi:hypothetical protein NDU88_003789 [Pleurodeles waltl]|uniref:Nuclear envelope integral membrane protein 2 n=1 Tax=Pleurodeles waltl TaxID=8319 RepID=A0AAV7UDH5_PLEWA|nr:hypothetical protein NDU88_003789 [Pleurodeles waltl]